MLLTIALLSLAPLAPVQGEAHRPLPERGDPTLRAHAVDQMMRSFVREHCVPGASLAIMKEGELIYARGFGWADPETELPVRPESLFRIASISKPMTAVAVLQLVEQKKLKLEENPFEVIGLGEALKKEGRDPRLAEITVEQLLHHRAGWDRGLSFDAMFVPDRVRKHLGSEGPPSQRQIIRFMLDQPLDHDPGSQYAYSNFGYCLLGRVIEARSGLSYEQYMQRKVLTPLGVTGMRMGRSLPDQAWTDEVRYVDGKGRTAFAAVDAGRRVSICYAHDQEVMDAHGGWIATAADLARFAAAFADGEKPELLQAATVARMWAPAPGAQPPVWYGMGWSVRDVGEGRRNAWHSGLLTGGTSTLLVRRHDGYTWAALFNTDRSRSNGKILAGQIDPLIHRAVNRVPRWNPEDER